MPVYLISDLHLAPERPQVAEGFYTFLETRAADAEALYILGDFFDAWIGDDEDHPFYLTVKEKLQAYVSPDRPVYFMHGNRDFLIGERFATDTGVTLLEDPYVADFYGHHCLLMHGDSLCTGDAEYMAFRAQVRDPAWQQQTLALPLEQRRAMAAQLREQSQHMNSLKAEDIMDVTPVEVDSVMKAHDVNTLIHGHTHRPARHTLDAPGPNPRLRAERIVLGDWNERGWMLVVTPTSKELVQFSL